MFLAYEEVATHEEGCIGLKFEAFTTVMHYFFVLLDKTVHLCDEFVNKIESKGPEVRIVPLIEVRRVVDIDDL